MKEITITRETSTQKTFNIPEELQNKPREATRYALNQAYNTVWGHHNPKYTAEPNMTDSEILSTLLQNQEIRDNIREIYPEIAKQLNI